MRLSIAALSLSLLSLTAALPNITRAGKYLYNPQGERFYLKGVAYQPQGQLAESTAANEANGGFPEPSTFSDPLSVPANCTRDLPYLRQLGVNAVRVYSVNSSLDHTECMNMFDQAGIYVLLDVSLPLNGSIDRSSPSWSTNLLNEYTKTIDSFLQYDNILGFNIGNEVVNVASNTGAAPFVKAAARDIKSYLAAKGSSALVGYSAVDGDADFRDTMAEYLTCGEEAIVVDLYGLNNYEWCGNSSYAASGWQSITEGFRNIPVATYMSEYGCIFQPPRVWNEVPVLFSAPVSDVFSGGMAFSYFPTQDGYGMVTFSADGQQVETSGDFDRLAAYYNSTNGPNSPAQSTQSQQTTQCPEEDANFFASTTLPPTPNEAVCNCINENAFGCRVRQASANQPVIVGELINYACSLLGQGNASCAAIAGNGTSGEYGQLAMCSPAIKLSYAMSAYFNINPLQSSCDFNGNASLSENRPNTAQDASTAAQSCLAAGPSGGVFTPTVSSATPSNTGRGGGGGASSNPSQSANNTGAAQSNTIVGGGWLIGAGTAAFSVVCVALGGAMVL